MKRITLAAVILFSGAFTGAYAADAKANWEKHCSECHASDGAGRTKMGKKLKIRDFTKAKVQAEFNDEQAFEAMKTGLMNDKGKVTMKAIEGLSDEEMKALVPFIRSLKK